MLDYKEIMNIINYNSYKRFCFLTGEEVESNTDIERVLNRRYSKNRRIKEKFLYIMTFSKYLYFVTFTFDNHYVRCSERTKRDLIKDSLSFIDSLYMLNKDFGSRTGREHYHCLLGTNDKDFFNKIKSLYPCNVNIEPIYSRKDFKIIISYFNKLVNHCTKDSSSGRIYYNFKGFVLKRSKRETLLYLEKLLTTSDNYSNVISREEGD